MISTAEYSTFDIAYKYFNEKLFNGELPDCIITFQRKKNCCGYFHFEKFSSRHNDEKISEIALNPDIFIDKPDTEILSTLVHEQVHLWQYYFSEPAKAGYHDRDWGKKMDELGLTPSNTGEEGGKRTGVSMTHIIVKNGPFDKACYEFLKNKKLNWQSIPDLSRDGSTIKKKPSRQKYECPNCEQAAWAKYESKLICGACEIKMIECE